MRKLSEKINIIFFLVLLPLIAGFLYDKAFSYSGNGLEDHQNNFKIGFILISLMGVIWLCVIFRKEKKYIWFSLFFLIGIAMVIFLYFAFAIINTHF